MKKSVYLFTRFWVRVFFPRMKIEGADNLPDGPAVIAGNHAQMNSPIACQLYFHGRFYIWTAGEMMHLKEVPGYAYQDFWSGKPKSVRWLYKGLSYLIAPLSVCIFNSADCIGVYHDGRVMSTFRTSVFKLHDGARIIVFPESYVPYSNIVWEFHDRFIDIARMYYRKYKEEISFVPMYVAPELKTMYLGKPVRYDATAPAEQERKRIAKYLMDEITDMARKLPEHTVVPYPNIPKRDYPSNKVSN